MNDISNDVRVWDWPVRLTPTMEVLLASIGAGLLWDSYGAASAFVASSAMAAAAAAALVIGDRRKPASA